MAASKKHFDSKEQALAFIDTLSYANIRNWLADFLLEDEEPMPPIRITRGQFEKYFKIIGEKADGTPEQRGKSGRPKKTE